MSNSNRAMFSEQVSNASFSLKRHVVMALVDRASNILPTRDTVPVLKNYQLDVSRDGLCIAATDTFLTLLTSTQLVEVESPGTVVMSGKQLIQIVREANGESINISIEDDNVIISSGSTTWTLRTVSEGEHLPLPRLSEVDYIELDRVEFLVGLEKVYPAASQDTSRPNLCIVDCSEGKMRASDGVRCAQVDMGVEKLPLDMRIPSAAVHDLMRIMRSTDVEKIRVGESSSHVVFNIGNDVFICGRILSAFPDIDELLINKTLGNNLELTCDREELISAVRRVRIVADSDSAALSLTAANNTLTLETRDERGNTATEQLMCGWSNDPHTVVINHNFLFDLLSSIDVATCYFYFSSKDTKTRKSNILHRDHQTDSISIISQMRADWVL